MKTLIIYYSLEGNCHHLATLISKQLNADLLRIAPVTDIQPNGFGRYLWGGHQAITKQMPQLMPYTLNLEQYDTLIIGSPVWASTYAPALRSFFAQHNISHKKIALFASSASHHANKAIAAMRNQLKDNEILGGIHFKDPLKQAQSELQLIIENWLTSMHLL